MFKPNRLIFNETGSNWSDAIVDAPGEMAESVVNVAPKLMEGISGDIRNVSTGINQQITGVMKGIARAPKLAWKTGMDASLGLRQLAYDWKEDVIKTGIIETVKRGFYFDFKGAAESLFINGLGRALTVDLWEAGKQTLKGLGNTALDLLQIIPETKGALEDVAGVGIGREGLTMKNYGFVPGLISEGKGVFGVPGSVLAAAGSIIPGGSTGGVLDKVATGAYRKDLQVKRRGGGGGLGGPPPATV